MNYFLTMHNWCGTFERLIDVGILVTFHLRYLIPTSGKDFCKTCSGLNFLEKPCMYEQLVYIFVENVTLITCDFVKFCCALTYRTYMYV